MWEVRTHPELVTRLDRAPVLWLHDEAKTQQSFTPGMRYRLKNLRKYDTSIYWTVEGLVRDSGKPAYLIVSRSLQDEPESFAFKPKDVCKRVKEILDESSVVREKIFEDDRIWEVLSGYPGEDPPEDDLVAEYLSPPCNCCSTSTTHGTQRINSICRIQERAVAKAGWIYE